MGMKKGQKQYGKAFTERMLEMKKEGKTNRQIAENFGVEITVIKNAIKRDNRRKRKTEHGEIVKKAGRPRIKPMTTLEELQKRNKELEMENELLKKFHEELRR